MYHEAMGDRKMNVSRVKMTIPSSRYRAACRIFPGEKISLSMTFLKISFQIKCHTGPFFWLTSG
jgi:hypothetical protein